MLVKELIEALARLNQDAPVVVDGYEGGYDDPVVKVGPVVIDTYPGDWEGKHSTPQEWHDESKVKNCVIISRNSYELFGVKVVE